MRIDELKEGQKISLLVTMKGEQLTLDTVIEQSIPNKNMILAKILYVEGKVITFRASNILVDLVVTVNNEPPQIFKNVAVSLVKKFDGTLAYSISSIAASKIYNRRESFRCYIGVPTSVQKMLNTVPYDAVIKDVSAGGFSLVVTEDLKFEPDQLVHVVLNDYVAESAENFSFHLYGMVVRSEDMDKNRILYGCKFNQKVNGLENYIMTKERLRLKRASGNN